MFTKKNAICIVSFLFFSGAVMSETNGITSSAETGGQAGFNTVGNTQTSQNPKPETDQQGSKAVANKQSGADKKPSMVEYCRKNIC